MNESEVRGARVALLHLVSENNSKVSWVGDNALPGDPIVQIDFIKSTVAAPGRKNTYV